MSWSLFSLLVPLQWNFNVFFPFFPATMRWEKYHKFIYYRFSGGKKPAVRERRKQWCWTIPSSLPITRRLLTAISMRNCFAKAKRKVQGQEILWTFASRNHQKCSISVASKRCQSRNSVNLNTVFSARSHARYQTTSERNGNFEGDKKQKGKKHLTTAKKKYFLHFHEFLFFFSSFKTPRDSQHTSKWYVSLSHSLSHSLQTQFYGWNIYKKLYPADLWSDA